MTKKTHTMQDKDVPHNMGKSDLIRASDFNFLMVLGKGSFGKVSVSAFLLAEEIPRAAKLVGILDGID